MKRNCSHIIFALVTTGKNEKKNRRAKRRKANSFKSVGVDDVRKIHLISIFKKAATAGLEFALLLSNIVKFEFTRKHTIKAFAQTLSQSFGISAM